MHRRAQSRSRTGTSKSRKMTKSLVITFLVPTYILCIFLIQCRAVHLHHQGFEIREVFPEETETSNGGQPTTFLLEMDLSTCACRNITTACDIAIAKSTILEITCAQNELYCCTGRKKQEKLQAPLISPQLEEEGRGFNPASVSTFPDEVELDYEDGADAETDLEEMEGQVGVDLKEDDTPQVNHRIVPVLDTLTLRLPGSENENEDYKLPTMSTKKHCRCKPRSECPDRYLDLRYSFFHCSHNTTRCCEPEGEISLELVDSGLQVLPSENLTTMNNEDLVDGEDLSEIDHEDEQVLEKEEEEPRKTCFCLPDSECSENKGWQREEDPCPGGLFQCCKSADENFGPQPIPLPELKIPVTEEIVEEDANEMMKVAAPPLPTYYNYQPPTHYSGYYPPHGRGQWGHDSIGNHRKAYPPPTTYVDLQQSRTIKADSLFDKIAQLIG